MTSGAVQDLSRPSASSAASLARMIGGLALAGTTAAITDQLPSPKRVAHPSKGTDSALPGAIMPEHPSAQSWTSATGDQARSLQQDAIAAFPGEVSSSAAGGGGSHDESIPSTTEAGCSGTASQEQLAPAGPAPVPAGQMPPRGSLDSPVGLTMAAGAASPDAASASPSDAPQQGYRLMSGRPTSTTAVGAGSRGSAGLAGRSDSTAAAVAAARGGHVKDVGSSGSIAAYRPGTDAEGLGGVNPGTAGDRVPGQARVQLQGDNLLDRNSTAGAEASLALPEGLASSSGGPPRPVQV